MPVMGSNMPKRVCSTEEEWAAFDKKMAESVTSFDNDRRAGISENDTASDLGRAAPPGPGR